MFEVTFNLAEFQKELTEAARAALLEAGRAALTAKAAELRAEAREQFLTFGRGAWPPRKTPAQRAVRVSPTLGRRGNHAPPSNWPLMRKTGRLMLSFVEEGNPAHVERIEAGAEQRSAPRLVFGSSIEYARFHQEGTSRMPARPILTGENLGGTVHATFPL